MRRVALLYARGYRTKQFKTHHITSVSSWKQLLNYLCIKTSEIMHISPYLFYELISFLNIDIGTFVFSINQFKYIISLNISVLIH